MDRDEAERFTARLMATLKNRRKALGLSQQAVAKRMGVQQSSVSEWETGRTGLIAANLINYADALDMKVKLVDKFPN